MSGFRKGLLVVAASLVALTLPPLRAQAEPSGFDVWPDRNSIPSPSDLAYLSPVGADHGFVDLGFNVTMDGREWRALQFTRDQTHAGALDVGKYLFGFIGDEWPARGVEVLDELRRARLTAMIVDGVAVPVGPSDLLDLSTPLRASAVYTAFPRFPAAGRHLVQYVWEQRQDFFFVLPLAGQPDPLGLDGRRVFVKGELVGDTLDGKLVVTYDLNPACMDGVDNDADGMTDFPADPGCTNAAAASETGSPCDDGLDNDADGLRDFPADPGCAGPLGPSESAEPACADGLDDDADGLIDFPSDPDCYAFTDPSEAAECADGADNDGDGHVDLADGDCATAQDRVEAEAPACADGADNDGDGAIDHPFDPGCSAANDVTEGTPAPSQREDVRLLVAVASSGSLNGDACSGLFTGGDGSLECPGADVSCGVCGGAACGNGIPDDSRLYQVKQALAELFLRTDSEFALLASLQRPAEFACPNATAVSGSGGWQGGGPFPCSGGFESGRLLVSFAGDNFWPLWEHVDGHDGYGGARLAPPPLDAEIRGTGSRPLGSLLTLAKTYADDVRTEDPARACRPYRAVLLTDGGESCTGDAVGAAQALLGGGVKTHVVGYAVPAGAADRAELNSIAVAGGTETAVFVQDGRGLAEAFDAIADEIVAQGTLGEACNGLDDDCDGLIDEGFPGLGQACDNGLLGVCRREGQTRCVAGGTGTECALVGPPVPPSAETCNGLDDDCDGFVDEGGVCGTPETCNALDDDGDGLVDEDFPVGGACDDGGVGVCRGTGSYECLPDHTGVTCVITEPGATPAPSDTTCDGRDDDCDGVLDENAVGEMVTVGSFRIDRYEASRPDATGADEGHLEHRACSKAGVLPWSAASWTEAAAQCAAAGKRLCASEEWEAACAGAGTLLYPYGPTYSAGACNGTDYQAGEDALLPTGFVSTCAGATGAMDMSGNVREWTETAGSSAEERIVHGGGYDSQAPALTCRFVSDEPSDEHGPGPRPRNLGFRCCSDVP